MLEELWYFISMQDPNIRYVVLGTVLLGAMSGLMGSFMFLRKTSLIGDAVAHSVLPGIALAFMLFNTKNILVLLGGAVVTGWLSVYCIDIITRRSRISSDTAISLVLSVFFGAGIWLLTIIQRSGNASQSGLDKFLFGKAASLVQSDVLVFGVVALLVLSLTLLFYKEFKLISFDKDYAQAIGLPVKMLEMLLSTMTVLTIAIGIQAVGVVLMSALLITPAAAARYWTNKTWVMLLLASILGMLASVSGSYISYLAPSMPTGPWIVVVVSAIAVASLLFAPRKGMLARWRKLRNNRRKVLVENILKVFFHLGEHEEDMFKVRTAKELIQKRDIPTEDLKWGLRHLDKDGMLIKVGDGWKLTDAGRIAGQRIVKVHRLWEMYLTQYLRLEADHVHDGAEAIEHIITPELEAELEHILGYPEKDPHERDIPYHEKGRGHV